MGFDINPTRYSKPERQIFIATDKETSAILKILDVKTDDLFGEVMTSGLAGGLLCPYKGLLPASI